MTEIFFILGLILLNGLFSMAEMALLSSRKARLEAQATKGDADAKAALKLANHPDSFLSVVQIGITLIGILTGIFSGEKIRVQIVAWLKTYSLTSPYSNTLATIIVVIIITYLSLIFGELLPKRIGLSKPEAIAKAVAKPMKMIATIMFPFVWLLSKSTQLLSTLLHITTNDNQVTEEEIKAIISEGTEQGTIDEAEQEIIERVFHLGDRNITSLMTHRTDISWLDVHKKVGEIKKDLPEVIHSVYPVCDGNIESIKGVVSIKELLINTDDILLSSIMKQPMYVPENITAYQVLEKFKETKIHHCFIVSEYGSIEGFITLNDILEAIVGDIPQPDESSFEITERADGSLLIDAQIPFFDFLHKIDKTEWIKDNEQNFDTLAGFILHELKKIPNTGDQLIWQNYQFEIVDMDQHRIDKILVTKTTE